MIGVEVVAMVGRSTMVRGVDSGRRAPREGGSPRGQGRAAELLARADAELLAAQYSAEAWEQFSHAHLAALRAAAAVVAAGPPTSGRGGPRTVWQLLAEVAPELARWATLFADAAPLRSAVDAGRFDSVGPARAEQALCDAEDFVDVVRAVLEAGLVGGDVERGRVASAAGAGAGGTGGAALRTPGRHGAAWRTRSPRMLAVSAS